MCRRSDTSENLLQLVEPLPSIRLGWIGAEIQETARYPSNPNPNSEEGHLYQAGDGMVSTQDSWTFAHTRHTYRPHDGIPNPLPGRAAPSSGEAQGQEDLQEMAEEASEHFKQGTAENAIRLLDQAIQEYGKLREIS